MTKIIFLSLICICSLTQSKAQEKKIFSKLPCSAEVWRLPSDKWEEILLCDLNPNDPSTWTWYYNFKSNKKGLLKMIVISQWKDKSGIKVLVKIPNNPNKFKLSQVYGTKDLRMEKVEGNMDIPYDKQFDKIQ